MPSGSRLNDTITMLRSVPWISIVPHSNVPSDAIRQPDTSCDCAAAGEATASPSNFTMYAQILGEIAVDILSRSCDNLTREGLMEAVESTKDFHSPLMLDGVNISFSPTDHVGFQSSRYLEVKVDANGKGSWEYFGPVREFQGEVE